MTNVESDVGNLFVFVIYCCTAIHCQQYRSIAKNNDGQLGPNLNKDLDIVIDVELIGSSFQMLMLGHHCSKI